LGQARNPYALFQRSTPNLNTGVIDSGLARFARAPE
jgi:hypothetical protein